MGGGTHGEAPFASREPSTVPFKYHAEHRYHIPKLRYRVTNWAEYDASLRQRGSLTVWFTDAAIAAWRAERRTSRGGQPWYSPLAILTALTLRAVFRLALRQTEGFKRVVAPFAGVITRRNVDTGDLIDARTAEAWGLVNAVVPGAELDAACLDLLRRATRGSASAKALGKQGFYSQIDLNQAKAYAYAIELMAAASQTPDARERMAAFLEKRAPRYD